MKKHEIIDEMKFSKNQVIVSVVIILALTVPVTDLIKQGLLNRDYRWFILFFFVAAYILWHFLRPTVLMLFGMPAVVITRNDITITERGYVIDWKDIDAINLVETAGRTTSYSLVLNVKDPWKYISTIKNPVMRYYRWYAKDYFYTPFSLSLSSVEGDSQELYDRIENYFHQYRIRA
jgi:hypothetical protein